MNLKTAIVCHPMVGHQHLENGDSVEFTYTAGETPLSVPDSVRLTLR
jgi:hypothetical protein